ncbi:MAG: phospho-N-acetylmuramoyl-pentapeptide-transferase [Deltaproteobacteria bacterium]|nr:MAG: phospho-N-acetylmuramoyl-pentapeptide-transferase [Deltaproteobacteria bacterium]
MFYHLLYPLHDIFTGFNVFRYITFRCICAAVTALLIMIVCGPVFIRMMKRFQIGQVVRDDGPASHLSKQGVPTMGGILILAAIAAATLLWARLDNYLVWTTLLLTLFYGMIGAYDDYKKIRKKTSDGLSARGKMVFQLAGASVVGLVIFLHPGFDGHLDLPFFRNLRPDLGWFYLVFAVLVIIGSSNAVNLTDGLDGLVVGPTMISAAVYLVMSYLAGHMVISEYLRVSYVPGAGELAVFCGGMVGACLGFLWFNAFPAQMFMGDVGSLALGGGLGTVAILVRQEVLLAVVGGIFVMEALSVMIQVGSFKFTGKRVFLMAPFHHHFEKQGWHEAKVVMRFWIISIILGLLALATLKLR